MRRVLVFALTLLLLGLSGCGEKAETGPVTVNIYGPDDVVLLEGYIVDAERTGTVAEALRAACGDNNIALNMTGSGAAAYVKSIGAYEEMSRGLRSGWVFFCDGNYASAGAGTIKPKSGGRVSFYFTENMGEDVMDRETPDS